MTIYLQDFRAGTRRATNEGLRIGAVRYLPRGVKKADYSRLDYFDVWLPILAPSRDLLSQYRQADISAKVFFQRYRRQMKETDPRQVIALLSQLARETPIAVGCYCENREVCHRSQLVELIREAARK